MQNLRNNKKVRLAVVALLIVLVIVLYFRNIDTENLTTKEGISGELQENYKPDTWEKKILLGVFAVLGGTLGMEATETDYDLGKLVKGEGLAGSKVLRDKEGNVVTDATKGKPTNDYNCDDFDTVGEAQRFYTNAGGVSEDTNRLDGDKDGEACESLPKGSAGE